MVNIERGDLGSESSSDRGVLEVYNNRKDTKNQVVYAIKNINKRIGETPEGIGGTEKIVEKHDTHKKVISKEEENESFKNNNSSDKPSVNNCHVINRYLPGEGLYYQKDKIFANKDASLSGSAITNRLKSFIDPNPGGEQFKDNRVNSVSANNVYESSMLLIRLKKETMNREAEFEPKKYESQKHAFAKGFSISKRDNKKQNRLNEEYDRQNYKIDGKNETQVKDIESYYHTQDNQRIDQYKARDQDSYTNLNKASSKNSPVEKAKRSLKSNKNSFGTPYVDHEYYRGWMKISGQDDSYVEDNAKDKSLIKDRLSDNNFVNQQGSINDRKETNTLGNDKTKSFSIKRDIFNSVLNERDVKKANDFKSPISNNYSNRRKVEDNFPNYSYGSLSNKTDRNKTPKSFVYEYEQEKKPNLFEFSRSTESSPIRMNSKKENQLYEKNCGTAALYKNIIVSKNNRSDNERIFDNYKEDCSSYKIELSDEKESPVIFKDYPQKYIKCYLCSGESNGKVLSISSMCSCSNKQRTLNENESEGIKPNINSCKRRPVITYTGLIHEKSLDTSVSNEQNSHHPNTGEIRDNLNNEVTYTYDYHSDTNYEDKKSIVNYIDSSRDEIDRNKSDGKKVTGDKKEGNYYIDSQNHSCTTNKMNLGFKLYAQDCQCDTQVPGHTLSKLRDDCTKSSISIENNCSIKEEKNFKEKQQIYPFNTLHDNNDHCYNYSTDKPLDTRYAKTKEIIKRIEGTLGLLKLRRIYVDKTYVEQGYKYKTDFQVSVLNDILKITPYPSAQMRDNLAILLNLNPRSIQIWFQNARQGRDNQMTRDELRKHKFKTNMDVEMVLNIFNLNCKKIK